MDKSKVSTSKLLETLGTVDKVIFYTGLPKSHTAIGMVKRTIKQSFSSSIRGKNLLEILRLALQEMRISVLTRLGKSPSEVLRLVEDRDKNSIESSVKTNIFVIIIPFFLSQKYVRKVQQRPASHLETEMYTNQISRQLIESGY